MPPQVNIFNKWLIKKSGKSWWQVHYDSGKVVSEWDTLSDNAQKPFGSSATSRWEEIPKTGIRELYLICPNGEAGSLMNAGSFGFFQLKVGFFDLGTSTGDPNGRLARLIAGNQSRTCRAHIIGKVNNENGDCTCYAWEYDKQRLWVFDDNINNMHYENIGPISLGYHTGIK